MGARLNPAQLPDFEGTIANGNKLRVFLETGPTFDEFEFEWDGAAADIEYFRIEYDGEERVRISGQQMLDREAYDGRPSTTNVYRLAMADPVARSILGEQAGGLVTEAGKRLLCEIQLAGTGIAGTETLSWHAVQSQARAEEFRLFIIPENVQITKTGDNDFKGFRRGTAPWVPNQVNPGAIAIRRSIMYGNITGLRVEQDGRFPFGKDTRSKTIQDAMLKADGKTIPSSSYVWDPIHRGNSVADMFDTFSVKGLTARITTGDSNDVTALTEYLEDVRAS